MVEYKVQIEDTDRGNGQVDVYLDRTLLGSVTFVDGRTAVVSQVLDSPTRVTAIQSFKDALRAAREKPK
ncbi:MAG: hypothetical protein AAGF73_09040 [Actinomycetota bacterium]